MCYLVYVLVQHNGEGQGELQLFLLRLRVSCKAKGLDEARAVVGQADDVVGEPAPRRPGELTRGHVLGHGRRTAHVVQVWVDTYIQPGMPLATRLEGLRRERQDISYVRESGVTSSSLKSFTQKDKNKDWTLTDDQPHTTLHSKILRVKP